MRRNFLPLTQELDTVTSPYYLCYLEASKNLEPIDVAIDALDDLY